MATWPKLSLEFPERAIRFDSPRLAPGKRKGRGLEILDKFQPREPRLCLGRPRPRSRSAPRGPLQARRGRSIRRRRQQHPCPTKVPPRLHRGRPRTAELVPRPRSMLRITRERHRRARCIRAMSGRRFCRQERCGRQRRQHQQLECRRHDRIKLMCGIGKPGASEPCVAAASAGTKVVSNSGAEATGSSSRTRWQARRPLETRFGGESLRISRAALWKHTARREKTIATALAAGPRAGPRD